MYVSPLCCTEAFVEEKMTVCNKATQILENQGYFRTIQFYATKSNTRILFVCFHNPPSALPVSPGHLWQGIILNCINSLNCYSFHVAVYFSVPLKY